MSDLAEGNLVAETHFETPRGVTRVEVRHGFAQVHVGLSSVDLTGQRILVLGRLADAGISHKYLKLTQDGLALVIAEDQAQATQEALSGLRAKVQINLGRSIILVHATGMREEGGMIASIVQAAISSGVAIDHVGDMHDKMFMVVDGAIAESAAERLRSYLTGGQP